MLAGALARAERGERVAPPLDAAINGFRAHWRATDGSASVEVIETAAGSWAIEPDGPEVQLHPVDAAWVFSAVVRLTEGVPAHA